jgi:hypothetical protein
MPVYPHDVSSILRHALAPSLGKPVSNIAHFSREGSPGVRRVPELMAEIECRAKSPPKARCHPSTAANPAATRANLDWLRPAGWRRRFAHWPVIQ